MSSYIIGTSAGLFVIVGIRLFLKDHERLIYALVLSGIGFLYVGFTWMDPIQLTITAVQAVLFLLLAARGVRNVAVLSAGYFLHGAWDLVYNYFVTMESIPPHYDGFCLSIDFVMGAYILIYKSRMSLKA